MNLRDRVRAVVRPAENAGRWTDDGVEGIVAAMADLTASWDPDADDPRISVSRSVILGAFADGTARSVVARPQVRSRASRPALVLVPTALVLLLAVGAVAASGPGGPLYDARVDVEGLTLPAASDERAVAQVRRLQERVVDATGAASRGDTTGVVAALRAYARIATAAAATPPVDPVNRAGLAARVAVQLGVIAAIGPVDPATRLARDEARVAGGLLLRALTTPGAPVAPDAGSPPSGRPGAAPPSSTTPSRSPAPTREPTGSPRTAAPDAAGPGSTGGVSETSDPGSTPGVPGPAGTTATPGPGAGGGGHSATPGATATPGASTGTHSTSTPDPGGRATSSPGTGGQTTPDPGSGDPRREGPGASPR